MSLRKPDFFIVGAPKCGTTALYRFLKQHPEIFMPRRKEPHFFCKDLDSGSESDARYFTRDENEYLSLFREAGYAKRVGEASATYLYSSAAASRIKEFSAEADIIIMLRNPVDMIYSFHAERLYNENEDIADLRSALEAEEERKLGLRIPKASSAAKNLLYGEVARFSEQVQRYLNLFSSSHVHIIIFDDLKSDVSRVYGNTLRFLGVNDQFSPPFKVVNPTRQVRINVLQRFLRKPPSSIRSFARVFLSPQTRKKWKRFIISINTTWHDTTRFDPALRSQLQSEFLPEVERLSKLLNRDLTQWCRDQQQAE